MTKLINSTSSELLEKFSQTVRYAMDEGLIIIGIVVGIVACQIGTPWLSVVPVFCIGMYWVIRAWLISRILTARMKGQIPRPRSLFEEDLDD